LTLEWSRPLNKQRNCKEKWEKKDREEVTDEKEATLGAAEEAAEEDMAEVEAEATAAAEVAVAGGGMIEDTTATAGRTETADQRLWKKVKKSMSQLTRSASVEME
jgi:hypothetical protein